jgi:hypothetical protein
MPGSNVQSAVGNARIVLWKRRFGFYMPQAMAYTEHPEFTGILPMTAIGAAKTALLE